MKIKTPILIAVGTSLLLLGIVAQAASNQTTPEGMKWISAGQSTMGCNADYALQNEKPAHQVHVEGFWIDEHDVTNGEFAKFITATGYVTTAERPVDWKELKKQLPPGTPKPPDSQLAPGSMVFTPSSGPVDLGNLGNWWRWMPGASWKHPAGPDSTIKGHDNDPVTQVSWDDAVAYVKWAGKRLPTEAEWEYAARGGLEGKRYAWGDEFQPKGRNMANTWTGEFPYRNDKADGFAGLSPVKFFPPNGYGLYDMSGNVWNWCSDFYDSTAYVNLPPMACCANPKGPQNAESAANEHVIKGGSFLCSPSYCESYRPSARRGEPADTGMSHIGFRCALSIPANLKPATKTASN